MQDAVMSEVVSTETLTTTYLPQALAFKWMHSMHVTFSLKRGVHAEFLLLKLGQRGSDF